MDVLIVLGHPHTGSFNHAIADTAVEAVQGNGHNALFHDLYSERFDPLLTYEERQTPKGAHVDPVVQQHCDEVANAEGIIIIHPNWWGQPPAILKGWVDRVIRPGIAYEFEEGDSGEGVPHGLLRAKAAVVLNTSDTPSERELEAFGDPLETIWKNCIFGFCGVTAFYRKVYGVIVTSTYEQRQLWLEDVRATVDEYFPRTIRA